MANVRLKKSLASSFPPNSMLFCHVSELHLILLVELFEERETSGGVLSLFEHFEQKRLFLLFFHC